MFRNLTLLAVFASLTLAGCASKDPPSDRAGGGDIKAGATSAMFRATGNEPGWRLDIGADEMTLLTDTGQTRIVAPTPPAERVDGTRKYRTLTQDHKLTVTITDRPCTDSMSGMPHPNTVRVVLDGAELTGCGGDPATLLQGAEWMVEDLNGAGLVKGSSVTLNFGSDGHLSGNASCNRFMSQYTLTREGLTIAKSASSMMMCEEPLMTQEKKFLDLLGGVQQFDVGADGVLILRTGDGRAIRARRG